MHALASKAGEPGVWIAAAARTLEDDVGDGRTDVIVGSIDGGNQMDIWYSWQFRAGEAVTELIWPTARGVGLAIRSAGSFRHPSTLDWSTAYAGGSLVLIEQPVEGIGSANVLGSDSLLDIDDVAPVGEGVFVVGNLSGQLFWNGRAVVDAPESRWIVLDLPFVGHSILDPDLPDSTTIRSVAAGRDGYFLGMSFSDTTWAVGEYEFSADEGDNGYLVAVDASGEISWIESIGSDGRVDVSHTKVDDGGDVYAAGQLRGGTRIEGIELHARGETVSWVSQINETARGVRWIGCVDAAQSEVVTDVAPGRDSSVAIVGAIHGPTYVDDELVVEDTARLDGFVAKFNDVGELEWFHTVSSPLDDFVTSVAVGDDGTIYVGGAVGADATIGGEPFEARGELTGFVAAFEP